MKHSVSQESNLTRIKLEGSLDSISVGDVRSLFANIIDEQTRDVVIDFTDVEFIDSSGIGAIVYLYKRLLPNRRYLKCIGLGSQPRQLFEVLHIDKILDIQSNT